MRHQIRLQARRNRNYEITISIKPSMDKKVIDELFNHIGSLCHLLQGEEQFMTVVQTIPINDKRRK